MPETPQRILVTGAAGYLASWIVEDLLRNGHTVHGTVRHLKDHSKIQHLTDLAARYPQRLLLFEADLLSEGSFDQAMQGCSVVIHTASPYFLDRPRDVEQQLIQPALGGTRNVLAAVKRTETIKRVVLTSSIAALYNDACDLSGVDGQTVQEGDVNPNTRKTHNPYAYSKTIAEQAAWEECRQQQRWDLVSMHPGAIFGPSLSKRPDATSVGMMMQFLNGTYRQGVPRLWLGLVDVRDAARAHVRAATLAEAHHRYIVVAESLRLLEIARLMRVREFGVEDKLPQAEVPKGLMWLMGPMVGLQRRYIARNVNFPVHFNNQRSQTELGVHYRAPAETLNDHIRQLVGDGLIRA
ncbi:NAD-dependent epimerase/dehydratase family protein [Deinococcus maricopensis]|uniref:NAD-dependent epimerase/dehydratase n=1 Tax=Deinococcus maricopensis (strain DSM 21211 / LMG 22137 / NRRL B-23946 / LB-34) TaxID=709986 RepID=E8U378_DEIML|nr:NAD-dependent epimerase/dehydratase family protein [Deinococcus maricopensis]ADV66023.1 NAD-dependent epimerase/dehydratase [Deinococcus maricopensis DSM 21211]